LWSAVVEAVLVFAFWAAAVSVPLTAVELLFGLVAVVVLTGDDCFGVVWDCAAAEIIITAINGRRNFFIIVVFYFLN
jgi:hypothetical protein